MNNEQERSMNTQAKSPSPPPLGDIFIGRGEAIVLLFSLVGLGITFRPLIFTFEAP
jgi:hypothetical protein